MKCFYLTTGNTLREITVYRGLKRTELAELTGISVSSLTLYEKGTTRVISGHKVRSIAKILKWPIERLFPEKEEVYVRTVNNV
jgi:transcriptional regulator with XRE-family HTH domain